jgi:phosphoadenosine phosphosulfate reductase
MAVDTEERRIVLDDWEAGELAVQYDDQEPQEVIRWGLETFPRDRIAVCTSFQIDGMAILDMAWRLDPNVRVFTVDTGRLPQETYELIDLVRQHYGLDVEVYFPETREVESLTRRHGANPFYASVPLRLTCCDIRKVRPLVRVLRELDGWVTGLRRDQWATRSNIRKIELDHDHGGLVKLNPLADWTEEEVWDYVRANNVPYHPLYDQGYQSIGCRPCTRPVGEGENSRSGRWWWESAGAPKECGMHCAVETGGLEHDLEVLVDNRH